MGGRGEGETRRGGVCGLMCVCIISPSFPSTESEPSPNLPDPIPQPFEIKPTSSLSQ